MSFIRHRLWKYFLPSCCLFTFFLLSFNARTFYIGRKSHFSIFSLVAHAFGVLAMKPVPIPRLHPPKLSDLPSTVAVKLPVLAAGPTLQSSLHRPGWRGQGHGWGQARARMPSSGNASQVILCLWSISRARKW